MRRALVVIGLVACGKETSPAPPPPVTTKVSEPNRFVAELQASKKPALAGPFAKLTLTPELTIEKAREIAPELVDPNNVMKPYDDWYEYKGDAYSGVSLRTQRLGDPDAWLVGTLRAVIDDDELQGKLTAAWGPPTFRTETDVVWLDPAARLRCRLGGGYAGEGTERMQVLDCGGYMPHDELIGTDKVLFGFEQGAPLLGSTPASLRLRYGRRLIDGGQRLLLWPTETSDHYTEVRLALWEAPKRITYFIIELEPLETARLLEAKFGKPQEDPAEGLVYRKRPRVLLSGMQMIVGIPDYR